MIFTPTPLTGAYLIDLEKKSDDRGFFARAVCEKEFSAHGLVGHFCQMNELIQRREGHASRYALSTGAVRRNEARAVRSWCRL